MFKEIINKTFAMLMGRGRLKTNVILPIDCAASYLLSRRRINFEDVFSFSLRYFVAADDSVWFVGYDFAHGIGHEDGLAALDEHVTDRYKRSLDSLLFGGAHSGEDVNSAVGCVCIDKHGCVQLLERIDFPHKADFTVWFLNYVFDEFDKSKDQIDSDVLQRILDSVECLKRDNLANGQSNEQFATKVIERFEDFEHRLNDLNAKICSFERTEALYDRLRDYHRSRANHCDDMSLFTGSRPDVTEYANVKFTRDTSKHPYLGVYLKPVDDGLATDITFVTGQRSYYESRKRKVSSDAELVYDAVHPNPQMEINRIGEELHYRNYNTIKRSKRNIRVECSFDTAKSFINECVY